MLMTELDKYFTPKILGYFLYFDGYQNWGTLHIHLHPHGLLLFFFENRFLLCSLGWLTSNSQTSAHLYHQSAGISGLCTWEAYMLRLSCPARFFYQSGMRVSCPVSLVAAHIFKGRWGDSWQ